MFDYKIVILRENTYEYPDEDEMYRPSVNYSEYIFGDNVSKNGNRIYDMVRNCF
jgi:hypothetical protein